MILLKVIMDGEGAWPDLVEKINAHKLIDLQPGADIEIAFLDNATRDGHPTATFRFELPDGTTVLAQTTGKLFALAARMLTAKYPNLLD